MASQKATLDITYFKPGTQPPIFVAGTFSDPQWEPQEMEYDVGKDGEHTFRKQVSVVPGTKIQYKFRVAYGDWWVLDEDAPITTDNLGNRNNVFDAPGATEAPEPGTGILSPSEKAEDSKLAVRPKLEQDEIAEVTSGGLDADASSSRLPVVANAAKALLDTKEPRSGTSTPGYARTAAEVADSAALVDQEEPEPEISDTEAGKTGYRRLSSTPIPEVAQAAAEVFTYDFHPSDDYLSGMEETHGEHRPSLFSHECVGLGADDDGDSDDEEESRRARRRQSIGVEFNPEQADLNDPTLEQFPLSRNDILRTVRKIETGRGEDSSVFDGVNMSPARGPSRRAANDILGDYYTSSPIMASPVATRPQERLRVSRSPHGSASSLSLQSISEAEEPEQPQEQLSKSPSTSLHMARHRFRKSADSHEDEGVSLKHDDDYLTDKQDEENMSYLLADDAVSPKSLQPKTPREPSTSLSLETPRIAVTDMNDLKHVEQTGATEDQSVTPKISAAEDGKDGDPSVIVQPTDEDQRVSTQSTDAELQDEPISSSIPGPETVITSSQLIKRAPSRLQPISRPGTPGSIGSAHMKADGRGWLGSFFNVLFSWIGGIIGRLFGIGR